MQKFNSLSVMAALVASMCALTTTATAAESNIAKTRLAGEKLDSGLGQLPHYRHWTDLTGKSLVGEKFDNGLGDLAHYSKWVDTSGTTLVGQSLDDGVGELPHYSKWADMSGKSLLAKQPSGDRDQGTSQAVQLSQK